MSHKDEQALPFFARYLEGQFCEDLSEEEMDEVQGGLRFAAPTFKYPPESPDGIVATLKYPSDREDVCFSPVLTKKFPSDKEDVVTLKFPSDGEDSTAVTPLPPIID